MIERDFLPCMRLVSDCDANPRIQLREHSHTSNLAIVQGQQRPCQQIWRPYTCISLQFLIDSSHQKKYKEAASLLEKLSITSMDRGWSIIDCALMKIYAQCLQHTDDTAGHINILLKLLLHRPDIGPTEGPQYMKELEHDLSQSTTRNFSLNPF
jgi:hypothetical protein